MRIARGKIAIGLREARILLDRHQQFRHRLFKPLAEEMSATQYCERRSDTGAGTEAQSVFDMLDRNIRLSRPIPESAAYRPTACETGIELEGAINQRHHC